MGQILLNGIVKSYGKEVVVKNLDLTVEPGEFLTILGPSGCGKTTTLRMIAGLEEPDQGTIKLDALEMVQLTGYAERYPSELSGGQQQRVAVARLIALRPTILLMDEPLSNLDAKLRTEMRASLKRLHRDLNATTVYVTHDQIEALT